MIIVVVMIELIIKVIILNTKNMYVHIGIHGIAPLPFKLYKQ